MSDHNKLTGGHYGLADVHHRSLRNLLGNHVMNFTNLAIGSTPTEISFDAFDYCIGGRMYERAADATEAVAILDYYGDTVVQAADTTCFYLVLIDAAGAEHVIKGQDDETVNLPGVPDGYALIGLIKIVTVGVTFTVGTTSFAAAGVTDTFYSYQYAPVVAP